MIIACKTVSYDSLYGFPTILKKRGSETVTYEDGDFGERSEDISLELVFRIYCLTWFLPKRQPGVTMPLFLAKCWEYAEEEALRQMKHAL